MIVWDRNKLDQLAEAMKSSAPGQPVKVKLDGHAKPITMTEKEAMAKLEELTRDFVTNPDQPKRPNLEGEEGE